MYCKLFASLYQGTLRGKSHEILVFTNLLAHADAAGHVDKHFKAISDEVGISLDEVKAALLVLESPDAESRSPEEAGARIVRMDEHRVWGWRIVNYVKYRKIRSEDDRREQNRLAQERFRNKSKHSKPPSAQAEGEAKAEEYKTVKQSMPDLDTLKLECAKAGLPESDAFYLFNHWIGNGFTNNGRPIKSWRGVMASWKTQGFLPHKNSNGSTLPKCEWKTPRAEDSI